MSTYSSAQQVGIMAILEIWYTPTWLSMSERFMETIDTTVKHMKNSTSCGCSAVFCAESGACTSAMSAVTPMCSAASRPT